MRRTIRAALVIAALASTTALVQAPASAATWPQRWEGSASYRASADFLPRGLGISAWGYACSGGDAQYFNMSLLTTSGSSIKWTSGAGEADGRWNGWHNIPVKLGTSYYFRWRGLNASKNPYYGAPCQGVDYDD